MQVVILCGGKGMRLYEETELRPKPIIEVGGWPILLHLMKIYAHYGHRDFVLCLGYKGQMIKDYFLNFRESMSDLTLTLDSQTKDIEYHDKSFIKDWKDWRITLVNTGIDTQTGGRLACIKKFLNSEDEDFFLNYSDGLADIDLNALYKYHKSKGRIATLTGVQPLNAFGVIEPVDGIVQNFQEKPSNKRGFISGGFFVCNKKIFDHIPEEKNLVFEDSTLPALAKNGELAAYQHNGFWYSVDTMKHLIDLRHMYAKGDRPWMVWEKSKNDE